MSKCGAMAKCIEQRFYYNQNKIVKRYDSQAAGHDLGDNKLNTERLLVGH